MNKTGQGLAEYAKAQLGKHSWASANCGAMSSATRGFTK